VREGRERETCEGRGDTMAGPELMTTEEYFKTPETLKPQELIFGRLRCADSPVPRHQQIIAELYLPMAMHVKERRLGTVWLSPLDVILDYERALIVQPDLFFINRQRLVGVPDRIRIVPDLVVEILSPHPRIGKLNERLEWFASYGVRECWLIHQFQSRTEVLEFNTAAIAKRKSYAWDVPLRSCVLPEFRPVLFDILDESRRA